MKLNLNKLSIELRT